ncbi:hypothetical protein IVB30_11230 [Bradyrhizobium sp. 200]|uniref:hypothetical protein n=1 Tax=Bradyrhizobium sp. 200 TaxID=2782665 RepID=UPI001FFF913B|nr:hypothetical protein [Bradyrhizobium sp. 200]UPJ51860.1 hypothetical protein IVB30_11230 [Bradyrhizobium sp. 200]
MKKIFRPRNVFLALTLLLLLWLAQFSYRTNYYCDPGDHPIQSEQMRLPSQKGRLSKGAYLVRKASAAYRTLLMPSSEQKIAVTQFDLATTSWVLLLGMSISVQE